MRSTFQLPRPFHLTSHTTSPHREKMEELRGSPMSVGSLEEIIDDNHAIVSSSVGPEYYVNILSSVNQDLLEPGCSVLLHNKSSSVVGVLADDTDPVVAVMKVRDQFSSRSGLPPPPSPPKPLKLTTHTHTHTHIHTT